MEPRVTCVVDGLVEGIGPQGQRRPTDDSLGMAGQGRELIVGRFPCLNFCVEFGPSAGGVCPAAAQHVPHDADAVGLARDSGFAVPARKQALGAGTVNAAIAVGVAVVGA